MALELAHFFTDEQSCTYLPQERAALEYRVMVGMRPHELDPLLARGWRRFGRAIFRPTCRACSECVSLRIPVADFHLSRSQRRARNRCQHLRVEVAPARVDHERLALYARWHAGREDARGWEPSPMDPGEYARTFGVGDACAREVTYRDGDTLVGVGICDESAAAFSAVYFFHDPAHARLSLGVNHVLTVIEHARRAGKAYVYLGYRVLGCPSLAYKAGYLPHELLQGRPALDELPQWRRVEG